MSGPGGEISTVKEAHKMSTRRGGAPSPGKKASVIYCRLFAMLSKQSVRL